MLVFPNCKINLGLNITRKRPDGYHDLETVFYPVPLHDALEVIQYPATAATKTTAGIQFNASGSVINGNPSDNLCVKAYRLLKEDFPELPAIQLHLHKVIPMGAGLGGGSGNGSFTLHLLNQKFELGLRENQLLDYALQLGSDCPFFIINKPCFASGRGEHLEAVSLDLKNMHLVMVNPGIHISTGEAFAGVEPMQPGISAREIIVKPIAEWKTLLVNDFETSVFKSYPELAGIKNSLYQAGALYASMSGSGSSVFGIFQEAPISLTSFGKAMVMQCTL